MNKQSARLEALTDPKIQMLLLDWYNWVKHDGAPDRPRSPFSRHTDLINDKFWWLRRRGMEDEGMGHKFHEFVIADFPWLLSHAHNVMCWAGESHKDLAVIEWVEQCLVDAGLLSRFGRFHPKQEHTELIELARRLMRDQPDETVCMSLARYASGRDYTLYQRMESVLKQLLRADCKLRGSTEYVLDPFGSRTFFAYSNPLRLKFIQTLAALNGDHRDDLFVEEFTEERKKW